VTADTNLVINLQRNKLLHGLEVIVSIQRIIIIPFSLLLVCTFAPFIWAKERSITVTVNVDLKLPAEAKEVRLWLPYPLSDRNQRVTNVQVCGNYGAASVLREGVFGNTILFAIWQGVSPGRKLTYSFEITRKEMITWDFAGKELPLPRRELKDYLGMGLAPATQAKVKTLATAITKNKRTTRAKARAIYDWVVDNMQRDPETKGCGPGIIERLLATRKGKCIDINSIFVALARAADIPAREILGIRIPKGKEGEMTKSQHCWAEFYLPGSGWVVVDPADVAKARFEQKLSGEQLKPLREYYFGAVDENRIAYGQGRGVVLNPPQQGEPLNYFMYPYAEVDGKEFNEDLYGFNIGYRISFKEKM